MENAPQSFRERLIDELNYQGISNRDFAQKVGISVNTLSMYLYRGSIPAADVAVRMAQALNTTAEYLVLGTEGRVPVHKNTVKSDWQKHELNAIVESLSEAQVSHFLKIAREFKEAVSFASDEAND